MKWVMADGTEVDADGNVTGASELANSLRSDAERLRAGYGMAVFVSPPPDGMERVRLGDPLTMDAWIREAARRARVEVTSAPKVEYPEADDAPEFDDDGNQRIY